MDTGTELHIPARGSMNLHGCLSILLIALFSSPTARSTSFDDFGLPPARPGCHVMDRDFVRLEDGSILYAELYSSHGQESMDILSGSIGEDGMVWDCLHTWDIMFDGERVPVPPDALVEIRVSSGSAWFTFIDDFMQYEGMVTFYLSLDLSTGEFTEGWVD